MASKCSRRASFLWTVQSNEGFWEKLAPTEDDFFPIRLIMRDAFVVRFYDRFLGDTQSNFPLFACQLPEVLQEQFLFDPDQCNFADVPPNAVLTWSGRKPVCGAPSSCAGQQQRIGVEGMGVVVRSMTTRPSGACGSGGTTIEFRLGAQPVNPTFCPVGPTLPAVGDRTPIRFISLFIDDSSSNSVFKDYFATQHFVEGKVDQSATSTFTIERSGGVTATRTIAGTAWSAGSEPNAATGITLTGQAGTAVTFQYAFSSVQKVSATDYVVLGAPAPKDPSGSVTFEVEVFGDTTSDTLSGPAPLSVTIDGSNSATAPSTINVALSGIATSTTVSQIQVRITIQAGSTSSPTNTDLMLGSLSLSDPASVTTYDETAAFRENFELLFDGSMTTTALEATQPPSLTTNPPTWTRSTADIADVTNGVASRSFAVTGASGATLQYGLLSVVGKSLQNLTWYFGFAASNDAPSGSTVSGVTVALKTSLGTALETIALADFTADALTQSGTVTAQGDVATLEVTFPDATPTGWAWNVFQIGGVSPFTS